MAIDPPESFTSICRLFHQDIDKQCPTIEAMADFAVGGLNGEERTELSAFLEKILSGDYNGGELKALWRRSPSDVYFRDGEYVRKLFELMKMRLAPKGSSES
jgi:hypothetical protein